MMTDIKAKVLTMPELKSRTSRSANFESEISFIKKISKSFSISYEEGLNSIIKCALEISGADQAFIQINQSEVEFRQEDILEILEIAFDLGSHDCASLFVAKDNNSSRFEYEDYRVLSSICEIASVFIQQHQLIIVEQDNLERVFNSTPSASAIWKGQDLIFERVNEAYQKLFPDLELVGKPFEEALPQRIVRDYPELFRNVLNTGKPFSIQEQYTPVQHYAGGPLEDHYYNVNFIQLKNKDGSTYGVYQHTVDITEQVEARKKIESINELLSAALKSRDVFMSIASHELNTPLTSLKMQTQLRRKLLLDSGSEAFTPETNLKFLDHNLTQIKRLTLLVNDMLDVGRINSGQLRMNKTSESLSDLLEDSKDRFSLHFEALGVKLNSNIEKDVIAVFDSLRIDQVITNFLTNAIKYAGHRDVTMSLTTKKGIATVSVKDSGAGISEENQARIFERFERATSERNVSGMGLGLYISKQIILAHDGEIGVNSSEGKGAEFYFKIPVS